MQAALSIVTALTCTAVLMRSEASAQSTAVAAARAGAATDVAACEALRDLPNLSITTAKIVAADGDTAAAE